MVLAVILLGPSRIAEVAAALQPVDIAGETNRTIYEAILRLRSAERPIDITLVIKQPVRGVPPGAEF